MTSLRAGQILQLDGKASPQFAHRALSLRLVGILPRSTYDGWVWLSGYQLDRRGVATARRDVFVQWAGVRVETPTGPVAVTVAPTPPPALHRAASRATPGPLAPSNPRPATRRPASTPQRRARDSAPALPAESGG